MQEGKPKDKKMAAGQDDNKKPVPDQQVKLPTKQQKEEDKEPFAAWGKEVDGLQAGLGFRPGEHQIYSNGDTVTLVVRVRNVGKEPTNVTHFQPGIERTLKATDGDGKAIPQPVVVPGDLDYKRKVVELPPGNEIDLFESS